MSMTGYWQQKTKKTVDIVLDKLKKDFKVPVGKVWRSQENEKTEIFINQLRYLKKVVEKYGMKDCKETSILEEPRSGLNCEMRPIIKEEQEEM